jgi:nucleotide-binding universal stress UspA family protein
MKVIVGIDGSERQADALALAAQLAGDTADDLIVAHAYEWSLMSDRLDAGHATMMREHAQAVIDGAVAGLEGRPYRTAVVTDMSVPRGLHALVDEEHPDVLVIGSCHRGRVGQTLLGGTGERLVHGASCPVAVAPRGYRAAAAAPRRIGVGFDGSPESRVALAWATDVAERAGATLRLVQVFEPIWVPAGAPGSATYGFEDIERGQLEQVQYRLDETVEHLPAAVEADSVLLRRPVARAIAQAAEGFDLLVIGSRGYGPLRSVLLGGVSHHLVRTAPCPLIVLPRSAERVEDSDAATHAVTTGSDG